MSPDSGSLAPTPQWYGPPSSRSREHGTRDHTYIHACMHASIHPYIHTHTQTYIPIYLPTYIPTYLRTYVHTYTRTYIHTCMHAWMHTYIHTSFDCFSGGNQSGGKGVLKFSDFPTKFQKLSGIHMFSMSDML